MQGMIPPQGQQYNPQYEGMQEPNYEGDYEYQDMSQAYGSIIKDLTDTDAILEKFELRLRGKKIEQGKVVDDSKATAYITTDQAARDFVDIIRSQVNRHNDFSYYEKNEINPIILGANYTITRWLMLQGKQVPTRYRQKIAFEAMGLINSSLHKALNGRMLTWTKGSFQEGRNITEQPQKKGIWEYIFPSGRKR